MTSLFSKPKAPKPPQPVRMPVPTDPEIEAAGARLRDQQMQRKGRMSTILTDNLTGSTGKLGG